MKECGYSKHSYLQAVRPSLVLLNLKKKKQYRNKSVCFIFHSFTVNLFVPRLATAKTFRNNQDTVMIFRRTLSTLWTMGLMLHRTRTTLITMPNQSATFLRGKNVTKVFKTLKSSFLMSAQFPHFSQ